MTRLNSERNRIKEMYLEEKISIKKIAEHYNCDYSVIKRILTQNEVKLRTLSEAKKLGPTKYWLGKKIPIEMIKKTIDTRKERDSKDINKIRNRKPLLKIMFKGENNPYYGKKHSEEVKLIIKQKRALQVTPFRDTSIEVKIQNFLKQLNIEFFTHQYLNEINHSYQCDILIHPQTNYLSDKKTVIECDGDYWHGNIIKYPTPNDMQIKQIEEDKVRTQELIQQGFRVIRLWERDINTMDLNDFKNILYENIITRVLM